MSAWTHCDWCGKKVPVEADELQVEWIGVTWAGGPSADYCTAACAVAGIERARDEEAARVLALMDEDTEP